MKICVDPGHGGMDPGAVGEDPFILREKDVNLAVSDMLRQHLQSFGHDVIMTREDDHTLALSQRTDMANTLEADVFVSIHCNSAGSSSAEGMETWIYTGSSAGRKVAEPVQQSLIEAFPTHKNRGVKEYNFHVLRATRMPAILVECEFLSNPQQLQFLADAANQDLIAEAIANGISTHIG